MMKLFQRIPRIKDLAVRRELARAHLIIVFLALSLLTLLTIAAFGLDINRPLAVIVGLCVGFVALISLTIYAHLVKSTR